ncbi:MAG TPA: hypothetical protein VEH06_02115 [Candidatus Bathyarchaeia archaeon]|nr:hypothetical protein [Candidatus Bathyarchaeia archaeon]
MSDSDLKMQEKLHSSDIITAHASEILVPKWKQYKKAQIQVTGFRNQKFYPTKMIAPKKLSRYLLRSSTKRALNEIYATPVKTEESRLCN